MLILRKELRYDIYKFVTEFDIYDQQFLDLDTKGGFLRINELWVEPKFQQAKCTPADAIKAELIRNFILDNGKIYQRKTAALGQVITTTEQVHMISIQDVVWEETQSITLLTKPEAQA